MDLHDIISELKGQRILLNSSQAQLNQLREDFNRQHLDLILEVEEYAAQVAELEGQARTERLEIYDGVDKGKIEGVSVKEYTVLVYDEDVALEYAKERLPDAVITPGWISACRMEYSMCWM